MLEPGSLLQNRYEILEPLGKGGMGAVFLARDQRLGNTVALKETFFTDSMLLAAFEREARLLAGLRHAGLPKVMDHFAEDNGQFLVMELIPGADLQDLLQEGGRTFQPEEVLEWADQILDALDYLHSQNPPIIHRDIKPQNLKLTSRNQIVLLDFGLAKSAANSTNTESGQSLFAYTPSYAPLEQIQGAGTDAQSDLYSLGATVYHLLTGVRPADALTRASAVLNAKPDPLTFASVQNPRVPTAVSEVLRRAMALKRDQRPASAAEMRKLLRDAAQSPIDDAGADAQTVLNQTGSLAANHIAGNLGGMSPGSAQRRASAQPLRGQAPPQTNPNALQNAPTYRRQDGLATDPNRLKSAATSPWPATPVEVRGQNSSSQGKMIAAAVVVVVALIIGYSMTRKSTPEAIEPGQTNLLSVEPEKGAGQAEATPRATSDSAQSQPAVPTTATPVATTSEPVAKQEETASQAETKQQAEPAPNTVESETTQKPAQAQASSEPEKRAEPQTQPAGRTGEPSREDDRRSVGREEDRRPPPPGMQPPPHGMRPPPPGMHPPPPGGRRRP